MWTYKGKQVLEAPKDYFGFVYKITNLENGKTYIGKKQLYFRRKVKLGKKELAAITDKRSSKVKYVTKESDWKSYVGSCTELKKDIALGHNIKKEILMFCEDKSRLTYFETKCQFCEGVIEKETYNDNINGKYYRKIFNETF